MSEQISVAVIGAGMAGRSHAAGYRKVNTVFGAGLPPVRLAAIADANIALGEDAARRYGFEKALPSWEAVAEDPSIDAVSIVVGNALHRPIAEALVAAGKHVLCEKPLAGSMEDARAMVELEQQRRRRHRRRLHLPPLPGHRRDPRPRPQRRAGRADAVQRPLLVRLRLRPARPAELAVQGRARLRRARRHRRARHRRRASTSCGPIVVGLRRRAVDADRQAAAAAGRGRRAQRRSGERRAGRGGERGHRDVHRPVPSPGSRPPSPCRAPRFGMPNGLGFDVYGPGGRASFDQHRPAEYLFDDAQPEARTRGAAADHRRPADALLRAAATRWRRPASAAATPRSSPTRPGRSSTRSPGAPTRCRLTPPSPTAAAAPMEIIQAAVRSPSVRRARVGADRRRPGSARLTLVP